MVTDGAYVQYRKKQLNNKISNEADLVGVGGDLTQLI